MIAEGLNGPFGLSVEGKDLYVAESEAGQVTHVNLCNGRKRAAVTGLSGPASVDKVNGRLAIVTGEAMPPGEEPPGEEPPGEEPPGEEPPGEQPTMMQVAVEAPENGTGSSSVFLAKPGRSPRLLADLLEYELEHNPDGQLQFDPVTNAPLDALSNPFDVIEYGHRGAMLVADAGANAVLKVSRRGHVSTFFVPPVIDTGACAGMPNNDPEHTGCDPVPTGLAYGPHNTLYVSTLTAEVPGEGRVYVLDARTGRIRKVIGGFNGPTGVAVAPNGTMYVSEVLHNAPMGDGPPPADFDPSTVGRIVKVPRHGERSYAAVTMPTGLEFENGKLYASAWSIAGFLGIADAGQVVQVGWRAFVEEEPEEPAPTTTTTSVPDDTTTTTLPDDTTTTTTTLPDDTTTTTTTLPDDTTTTTTMTEDTTTTEPTNSV